MKRRIISIIIVLSLIFLALQVILLKGRDNINYKTMPVERGDISVSVSATGALQPVTTVLVGSQVSGRVKDLFADFNSVVRKGQILAQLDPSTFEAKVSQARANLSMAKAGMEDARASLENAKAGLKNKEARALIAKSKVNEAKVTMENAKRNLNRITLLAKKGVVSESEKDSAQTNFELAEAKYKASLAEYEGALVEIEGAKLQVKSSEARLRSAEARLEQSRAALDFARANLSYTIIRSPIDGIVISRNVDVGQTMAASFQTPTLFTLAEDLSDMLVYTNVDEADIGKVKVGQKAKFTVDAHPKHIFLGEVIQIRLAPMMVQNVVTYNVLIKVQNKNLLLKPGMTATVSILVDHREEVLKVHNMALSFNPDGKEKKSNGVWVLGSEHIKPVEISLGISDGNYTEVIGGNIKEGQDVIIGKETSREKKSFGFLPFFFPRRR